MSVRITQVMTVMVTIFFLFFVKSDGNDPKQQEIPKKMIKMLKPGFSRLYQEDPVKSKNGILSKNDFSDQ